MSKILIIIATVFVIGCTPKTSDFDIVTFNGHSYVIYDGYDNDSGMVHDPDCKMEN